MSVVVAARINQLKRQAHISHPILTRDQTGSNIDTIYVNRTFRPRTIGITITSRH